MPEENKPVEPVQSQTTTPTTPQEPPAKKYSEEERNAFELKAQEKATASLLKDLGVESTGKLKDDLKLLRQMQDKGKTEAERAEAAAKEATEKLAAAESRALAAELKADGLAAGIDPKKIDRAAKIIATYEGETSADKVAAFLAENPEFLASAKPAEFGASIKNGGISEQDQMLALLKKQAGIK